ncbi:MAG TPA: FtsQ-type POTRA domain-containing protein [Candidatus Binatia bacterium]
MQLKVYRRDNRKKDHRGGWRRRILRASALLSLLLFAVALHRLSGPLSIAAASLREFILESPYFSVREIQVRGGDKVSGNEIVAMAGLRRGMSIWSIDLASIEKKIAKHPWVRRVFVRREFPRRVVIDVEERTPKAIVAMRKLYYVDSDGVVFKEVGPGENVKFPLLTGLRAEQLTAPDPATRRRIQDALRLGEMMVQRSHSLSEIHFAKPDRLVVYTTEYPIALHMGWGNWAEKLNRMERLLALWQGHEERLGSLDMSFRDQVVARLRQVPR